MKATSSHACIVVEGRTYSLEPGEENSIYERSTLTSTSDRALIVNAFRSMREAIEEYSRRFRLLSRRLFGFSVKLDTPPPIIADGKVYTGFWAGIYEYTSNHGGSPRTLRIIVLPQLRKYHDMIRTVDETLSGLAGDFQLLVKTVPSSSASFAALSLIERIMLELSILASREPKRLVEAREALLGERVELRPTARDPLAFTIIERAYKPNAQLLTAIALAVRNIAEALRRLEALVEEARESAEELGFSDLYERVELLARDYVDSIKARLAALLEDEAIRCAVTCFEDPADLGRYDYLVYASQQLRRGLAFTLTGEDTGRQLLYPSTKIYELYVYANTIQSCAAKGLKPRYKPGEKLTLEINGSKLYFNHYPRRLSRLVAALTLHRIPKPDILYHAPSKAVIIDAKYRRLDSTKPRALTLPDAERIAAYLLDAARNLELKAVIASLTKPDPTTLQRIKHRIKPLNGKEIRVDFVEVNPDTRVEDIAEHLGL